MRTEVKGRRVVLGLLAGAVLLLVSPSNARAQGSGGISAEQARNMVANCEAQPDLEDCGKLREMCMGPQYQFMGDTLQGVCNELGWTRELATKRAIKRFKEHCDLNDSDAECNELRKSCREETMTCEIGAKLVCDYNEGKICERQYVCAEPVLRGLCSGKSEPGSEHMLVHANYTSIGDTPMDAPEFQSAIYSLSALTHGMTGNSALSGSYVVDMGIGWIRGTDNNGLAYELQALIGAGMRKNEKFMVGAAIGGGFSGIISGDLGFGWLVSTELFATAEIIPGIDVLGFLRPTFVFSEDARQDGSDTLGFADELKVGATLTYNKKRREGSFVQGTGYGVTMFMQEQLGVRMVGIGFGMSSSDASSTD